MFRPLASTKEVT